MIRLVVVYQERVYYWIKRNTYCYVYKINRSKIIFKNKKITCNISMIFNLVSITNGNSFMNCDALCWAADGDTTARPIGPKVNDVITAPMSPMDRTTPPSASKINCAKRYSIHMCIDFFFSLKYVLWIMWK